jgi:hypothetical protein
MAGNISDQRLKFLGRYFPFSLMATHMLRLRNDCLCFLQFPPEARKDGTQTTAFGKQFKHARGGEP